MVGIFEHILIPYNGTSGSEKAFEKALEIAEKFESKLTAMTVIQSKTTDSAGMSLTRMQEI
ncbi:MAG: universal stress protein, partial [Nitrosopumilus sp.]|nr:universal stress protein [Nitrosopumilus sp.]MDH3488666.1 universal stress protein [Nitrosopumilus sp.]